MDTTTTDFVSYMIPEYRIDDLREKLDKINRKADRLGVPRAVYEITDNKVEKTFTTTCRVAAATPGWDGLEIETSPVTCVEVRMSPESIVKLDGWRLLGVIEHRYATAQYDDDGNKVSDSQQLTVIKEVPGEVVDAQYRDNPQHCDHCGHDRYRTRTFIVGHDDGRVAQVGSTCLASYLGIDASKLTDWASCLYGFVTMLDDFSDEASYRGPAAWPVSWVLFAAAGALTQSGRYVPRREAGVYQAATAEIVETYLSLVGKDPEKAYKVIRPEALEKGAELYGKAQNWFDSLEPGKVNGNYEHNLTVLKRLGVARSSDLGLLASVPYSVQKKEERELANQKAKKSAWQGTPKAKIGLDSDPLEVRVIFRKSMGESRLVGAKYSSKYYATYTEIIKFEDREGNLYTWWTSSDPDFQDREWFPIIGTVKKHETDKYRGGACVTVLTRVVYDPEKVEKNRQKAAKQAAKRPG